MKILFFGTASISKAFLEDLYKNGHELLCVTMPDKPADRGQKLAPPAVKVFAQENKIPFLQPVKFTPDVIEEIKKFKSDAGIAVAYGKLIPSSVYLLPQHATFNIHFSLLPKYRGAAPVQYALWNGETETGVSSFYLEDTLDTGAVIVQEKMQIDPKDTAEILFNKLIPIGIDVMNKTLECFKKGKCAGTAQTGESSYAPTLKKEDGLINWQKSAKEIFNQYRAMYPWPGIYAIVSKGKLEGKRIKIIEAEAVENSTINEEAGRIYSTEKNKGFTVLCAKGKLLVTKVQPENKPVMDAWAFIQGGKLSQGDYL